MTTLTGTTCYGCGLPTRPDQHELCDACADSMAAEYDHWNDERQRMHDERLDAEETDRAD